MWLLWQTGWHLAFNYWIDFRVADIDLLLFFKLMTESVFYAISTYLLFRKVRQVSIVKILVLVAMFLLLVFTLKPFFID